MVLITKKTNNIDTISILLRNLKSKNKKNKIKPDNANPVGRIESVIASMLNK